MKFLKKNWFLLIIGYSVGWQSVAKASFISGADSAILTTNSDIIVVGRVIKTQGNFFPKPQPYTFPSYLAEMYSSDHQQRGNDLVTLKVDRTIKGKQTDTINFESPILLNGLSGEKGSRTTYGLFFLRQDSKGQLVATDAIHLGIIAVPKLLLSTSSLSIVGRVANELANVLATPVSAIIDPISGVGSENISANGSDLERAEGAYFEALTGLWDLPKTIRLPLLRTVANGSGELSGRLLAASQALIDGDDTLFPKFVPLLMKPNPNLSYFMLGRLNSGLQSVSTPKLTPVLTKLLKSPLVEMRRGAAVGLGGIADENFTKGKVPSSITTPLGQALQDPDYGVRYHAVISLARASEKCVSPAFEFYKGSEEKYLSCWRKWAVEHQRQKRVVPDK